MWKLYEFNITFNKILYNLAESEISIMKLIWLLLSLNNKPWSSEMWCHFDKGQCSWNPASSNAFSSTRNTTYVHSLAVHKYVLTWHHQQRSAEERFAFSLTLSSSHVLSMTFTCHNQHQPCFDCDKHVQFLLLSFPFPSQSHSWQSRSHPGPVVVRSNPITILQLSWHSCAHHIPAEAIACYVQQSLILDETINHWTLW